MRSSEGLNVRVSKSVYCMDENQQQSRHQETSSQINENTGAACSSFIGSQESLIPNKLTENSVDEIGTLQLLEEVLGRENLKAALRRVKSNKGAPGVDGMTVEQLPKFLKQNWETLKVKLLEGKYLPQPVKRVEIPKPDGGLRKLGIPTVLDRFIQQALMQVLQKYWDKTFSEFSYGFRPNRSAQQAIRQAKEYIESGYSWVVDIDLEQFFDRVNHDRLMSTLAKRVRDKRVLKLIRRYLNSGVMEEGLFKATTEGTPQGGPLSPLLSNLVLDELDKELEYRKHCFVRYADDCNIYVKSEAAGKRVMESLERFITKRLKLKVNKTKSAVARPWERKFLGFTFGRKHNQVKPAKQSLKRFKERVRRITRRTCGRSMLDVVMQLNLYLQGWLGYFKLVETKQEFVKLDGWIRRRFRCLQWKQWGRRGYRELRNRGVSIKVAWNTFKSCKSWWRIARTPALYTAMPNKYFKSLGLISLC